MAKEWKLYRLKYGDEEFKLTEGENVTIGRADTNNIQLISKAVSRNHCLLSVKNDEVLITDLKSANGVFVGRHRIPPSDAYALHNLDIIGIGWQYRTRPPDVTNKEKFAFKLCHEHAGNNNKPIQVDSDSDSDEWLVRLPKPLQFIRKAKQDMPDKPEDSSYCLLSIKSKDNDDEDNTD